MDIIEFLTGSKSNPQPIVDSSQTESPIELEFIYNFAKFINPIVKIIPQYQVRTNNGSFRLDFAFKLGKRTICVECDGENFHNKYRDEFRDASIIYDTEVDTIFRFRGKDIYNSVQDCIYFLYCHEPSFLNNRYIQQYDLLISKKINEFNTINSIASFDNLYLIQELYDEEGEVIGFRDFVAEKRTRFYHVRSNKLFNYLRNYPGKSLDEVIELWEKEKVNKF